MNSTVYDFFYEGDAYLGLFGLALAVSVGVLAFVGVFFAPVYGGNKWREKAD